MALLKITAAVLVGGRSRRMGQPKALLRLESDGPTFIEQVVRCVSSVADEVVLVGDHDWPLPEKLSQVAHVPDDGMGAASGVLAALQRARHGFVLVVACDMPFLDAEVLCQMVDIAQATSMGVVALDDVGTHPLHAIYRAEDYDRVERIIAAGERSLTALLDSLEMRRFDCSSDVRARWSVFNVNTPEELAAARRHIGGESPGG
jgi:molybdopterin-guanine dinucleotide biosynthesis protein A